jgi:ABC-type phosphate transport system substrate-binding protein
MVKKIVSVVAGLVLFASTFGHASDAPAPFKVIVNPSLSGRAVSRQALAQVYLGGAGRWSNGSAISSVDLSSTSPIRQAFAEQVLGMSIDALKVHWLRKIATGERPPLSKATDEEVIAFVAGHAGGVGYVSVATEIPPTVREVSIQ